jgi:ketosteroid isomerase-like protein
VDTGGRGRPIGSRGEREGRTLDSKQAHLFHMRDDRVVEVWQFTDGTADEFWS